MPQDPVEGTKHFARFTLPNGEAVDGEFLLDGPQTCVVLYTDRYPFDRSGNFSILHADLPVGRWLSFLKCVRVGGETSRSGAERQINRVRLYPHFATLGTRAFAPDGRICRLGFVADDFAAIYYHFDAFGFDMAPEEHIGEILENFHARIGRRVEPGDRYDVGRLVSSANMFDILPVNAVPLEVDLPEDLQTAKSEARRIFKALPQSDERNSVLSELGRLGKAKLKHKARHRGQIVLTEAGERFPDLILVLEEAVNCRNHYVHGSLAKIDYRDHFFETVSFFTDTLEFVFAASDLIEAGWSMTLWLQQGTTGSHPFGTYCSYYKDNLRALRELLDATAREAPGIVTES